MGGRPSNLTSFKALKSFTRRVPIKIMAATGGSNFTVQSDDGHQLRRPWSWVAIVFTSRNWSLAERIVEPLQTETADVDPAFAVDDLLGQRLADGG